MKLIHINSAIKIYEDVIHFVENESSIEKIRAYLFSNYIYLGICNLFLERGFGNIYKNSIMRRYCKTFTSTNYVAEQPLFCNTKEEILESLKIRHFVLFWELTFRLNQKL